MEGVGKCAFFIGKLAILGNCERYGQGNVAAKITNKKWHTPF